MSLVWNPVRAMYQYADVCEWISHVMQKARSFSNIFFVEKEMFAVVLLMLASVTFLTFGVSTI